MSFANLNISSITSSAYFLSGKYCITPKQKTLSKDLADRDKKAWKSKQKADFKAATPPAAGETGYQPPPTAGAAAAPGAGKGKGKKGGKRGKKGGGEDEE